MKPLNEQMQEAEMISTSPTIGAYTSGHWSENVAHLESSLADARRENKRLQLRSDNFERELRDAVGDGWPQDGIDEWIEEIAIQSAEEKLRDAIEIYYWPFELTEEEQTAWRLCSSRMRRQVVQLESSLAEVKRDNEELKARFKALSKISDIYRDSWFNARRENEKLRGLGTETLDLLEMASGTEAPVQVGWTDARIDLQIQWRAALRAAKERQRGGRHERT